MMIIISCALYTTKVKVYRSSIIFNLPCAERHIQLLPSPHRQQNDDNIKTFWHNDTDYNLIFSPEAFFNSVLKKKSFFRCSFVPFNSLILASIDKKQNFWKHIFRVKNLNLNFFVFMFPRWKSIIVSRARLPLSMRVLFLFIVNRIYVLSEKGESSALFVCWWCCFLEQEWIFNVMTECLIKFMGKWRFMN